MAYCLTHWCTLTVLLFAAVSAPAQTLLNDPTRPPAGVLAAIPDTAVVTGPVLQSIVIPKKGKPIAVIGGQQVRLGGLYGESRLVRLTEREAVLDGPAGIEHLLLTPGIEKTNIIRKNLTKSPAAKPAQSGSKP